MTPIYEQLEFDMPMVVEWGMTLRTMENRLISLYIKYLCGLLVHETYRHRFNGYDFRSEKIEYLNYFSHAAELFGMCN
jgi:hypothetical protein